MKKPLIAGLTIAAAVISLSACTVEDATTSRDLSQSDGPTVSTDTGTKAPGTKAPAKKADKKPKLTGDQENAIDKANSYLDLSAHSRKGLIEQLKFEGFNQQVSAFAVDYIHPDWNVQAAKKAAEYLAMTSYSRSGLVDQLKFEGFTPAQAQYGANKSYH